jgi:hypothetical protein
MKYFVSRSFRNRSVSDPFTDLLFNALLGFTFLFLIAVMLINPVAKTGVVDPNAEYIITITWEDNSPDDIDTWVEDPNGNLVWFRAPEAGLIHLARDDRGQLNDTIMVNGKEIANALNQEVVTIRGIVPGEYVLNLHYYASETGNPVSVSVRVDKLNPALQLVYYGTVTLQKRGDETTAIRFSVQQDGSVTDINQLNKKLVIVS